MRVSRSQDPCPNRCDHGLPRCSDRTQAWSNGCGYQVALSCLPQFPCGPGTPLHPSSASPSRPVGNRQLSSELCAKCTSSSPVLAAPLGTSTVELSRSKQGACCLLYR